MTVFFRLLDVPAEEKQAALRALVADVGTAGGGITGQRRTFERQPNAFSQVPGSPFAYWVSDRVRETFSTAKPLQHGNREARFGASPKDRFRFVLATWEIERTPARHWVPLAKGGVSSSFYSDVHLVVRWRDEGHELKAHISAYRNARGWGEQWSAALNGYEHYGRPGLTWTLRTQGGLALRAMPGGCIFADKGPGVFIGENPAPDLLALLAITNSSSFRFLVELQMAFGSYEVGVIQRTPVPSLAPTDRDALADLARRAWSLKRQLDTVKETSHAFLLPVELIERVTSLNRANAVRELAAIQKEIDERAFALYDIDQQDRAAIESPPSVCLTDAEAADEDEEPQGEEHDAAPLGIATLPFNSWLVGVAFGRFDKRLATGERPLPAEPEPFDALPNQAPAMWPGDQPRKVSALEFLLDDPGHELDLVAHVTQASLGTGFEVAHDIRRWIAREFFALHIKMYSMSRRKAPIYWQLGTPSASYSVWLYLHAFTKDTLYRIQNDYAAPKLAHEERRLEALRREAGESPRAADRKALAEQESFVDELRGFLAEVKLVVPVWTPNLDDGVLINFAPLWRLVAHHKGWQKELKATWDALCRGQYDWAHLAMHLWPERVVPQCAIDRSLAIAHGLEDVFWVEGVDGKWKSRPTPVRPVEVLVAERTSPAARAGLKNLLAAPSASGNGRARVRRAASGN